METRPLIRQFFLTEILPDQPQALLQDDTPLRESGILDSMSLIKLVAFLESSFGIEIELDDASGDAFSSIANLTRLVNHKLAAAIAQAPGPTSLADPGQG